MKREKLLKLANKLSNEDLLYLLNVSTDRLSVYCGYIDNRCVTDDVLWCSMNGTKIQLNLMHCEEDLRKNRSWHYALYGTKE